MIIKKNLISSADVHLPAEGMWEGDNGQKKDIIWGLTHISLGGTQYTVLVTARLLVTNHWEGSWHRSSG